MRKLVHARQLTFRASDILFGGGLDGISESTFNDIVGEVPSKELDKGRLEGADLPLAEILVLSGLAPSKGQARKDVEAGGVYINNVRATDAKLILSTEHLLFEKFVLLRKGKRNYALLKFEE